MDTIEIFSGTSSLLSWGGDQVQCLFLMNLLWCALQELSKLQDRVPAFSSVKAIDIVEKELGGSVPDLFESFDIRPIAAASLGQVSLALYTTCMTS